jgi:hypothetical protein
MALADIGLPASDILQADGSHRVVWLLPAVSLNQGRVAASVEHYHLLVSPKTSLHWLANVTPLCIDHDRHTSSHALRDERRATVSAGAAKAAQ